MKMSVGVLDHYNVSTRKLGETIRFYEDVLGFSMVRGRRSTFLVLGYTAAIRQSCTSTISRRPTSSSAPTQGSSIMSRLAAAASTQPKSTWPKRACLSTSTKCPIALVGRFSFVTRTMWKLNVISRSRTRPLWLPDRPALDGRILDGPAPAQASTEGPNARSQNYVPFFSRISLSSGVTSASLSPEISFGRFGGS
jgi:hypothetical protein